MVKFWDAEIKVAHANFIRRIKIMEKHGVGQHAIQLKSQLKRLNNEIMKRTNK